MKKLSKWHQLVAKSMTRFYFSTIEICGSKSSKPTLFIASHRNGATDGQIYAHLLKDTPFLISIQMLRHWFLRLIFDGIAVVRQKDVERYQIARSSVSSPLNAAVEQIRQGGSLCLMPEGTSEWGYRPLPYKIGMAAIVAQLKQQEIDFDVQCIGVFYSKPDGFRSRVSIIIDHPLVLKSQSIKGLFQELSDGLNRVSVNCQSITHFNQVQAKAWQSAQHHTNYGQAFLEAQQQTDLVVAIPYTSSNTFIENLIKLLFFIAFFPTIIAARLSEKAADGRNNVSFFRLLGGFYASLLTLLFWTALFYLQPVIACFIILLGWCGWYFYPEPTPDPLEASS